MGDNLDYKSLKKKIKKYHKYIDTFVIMGGEPLHQDKKELIELLEWLIQFQKSIWFYTSYEINEIPEKILKMCAYIKTGQYKEELRVDHNIQYGVQLITSNQKIYKTEEL